MSSSQFCLIRKYKKEDTLAVRNIITEATMEQVGNFFWGAVLSELLPQVCLIFIAFGFIVVGVPLKFCLMAIPFAIIALYMLIWMGHWIKATELSTDLENISSNYMNDPYTTFYVAEIYGKAGEAELASVMGKVKKVEYNFYNEKEFEVMSININGLSRTVVGSIAVTRSMHHSDRAWIRRMAVKKEYRRRRIAARLLTEALVFCEERRLAGVELLTTECHGVAKQLYENEGFKEVDVSHRSFFGFFGKQVLYHMYRPTPEKELAEEDLENAKDK